MRLLLVERKRWITQREFLEDWALSRLSPGVHLVALTALLGRRIRGLPGAATAVMTMIVPAGIICAAITAGYGTIRDEPLVQKALAGAGPVTIGLTLGITYVFARSSARRGWQGVADWALLAACAVVGVVFPTSPLPVVVLGATVGALLLGRDRNTSPAPPME